MHENVTSGPSHTITLFAHVSNMTFSELLKVKNIAAEGDDAVVIVTDDGKLMYGNITLEPLAQGEYTHMLYYVWYSMMEIIIYKIYFSPGIIAPQRGGTSKSVQYLKFFDNYLILCLQNNI